MGIINNLFGNKERKEEHKKQEPPVINWVPLTSIEQLSELEVQSKKQTIGIFKHSTRCVISRTVLKRFEESFSSNLDITMYYLDLLTYRDVSNEVGYKFQVIHQSPQLLLIKNGEVIQHASHYDIIQIGLEEFVK